MISGTSGRTEARNSKAPPIASSTATITMVCPSRRASSSAASISGVSATPPNSRKRRLPTRILRPLHTDGDAVTHFVLCAVGVRKLQPFLFGFLQDRQRDRVMEPVLCGGCVAQDIQRRMAIRGDDLPDFGPFTRQRPRLVKQDGVDVTEQIQRSAVLHQDASLRAQCQRGQHRHSNAGAHIAVEHGGGALRPHRAERERSDRERGDHRFVGKLFALVLRGEPVPGRVV